MIGHLPADARDEPRRFRSSPIVRAVVGDISVVTPPSAREGVLARAGYEATILQLLPTAQRRHVPAAASQSAPPPMSRRVAARREHGTIFTSASPSISMSRRPRLWRRAGLAASHAGVGGRPFHGHEHRNRWASSPAPDISWRAARRSAVPSCSGVAQSSQPLLVAIAGSRLGAQGARRRRL